MVIVHNTQKFCFRTRMKHKKKQMKLQKDWEVDRKSAFLIFHQTWEA